MRSMRESFGMQIEEMQRKVSQLANCVVGMLVHAMRALTEQDPELAERVIAEDDIADQLDLEIERDCMRLLALQQPMAKDLRIIGTALKLIADFERVGDYAVDIAKSAQVLAGDPYFKPLEDIPRMGELTEAMVRDAARAFLNHDLELVHRLIEEDEQVDRIWYALLDELIAYMQRDPSVILQATHLLLVARYLERIADHMVNVAERVAYAETGRFEDLALSHGGRHEAEEQGESRP